MGKFPSQPFSLHDFGMQTAHRIKISLFGLSCAVRTSSTQGEPLNVRSGKPFALQLLVNSIAHLVSFGKADGICCTTTAGLPKGPPPKKNNWFMCTKIQVEMRSNYFHSDGVHSLSTATVLAKTVPALPTCSWANSAVSSPPHPNRIACK